jgi:hypothetical protein
MSAIVQTLVNVFRRLFGFLGDLWGLLGSFFESVWSASIQVVDLFLAAIASIVVFGIQVFVDIQMFALETAVQLLPMMPQSTDIGDFSLVALANRYMPLGEIGALGSVWALIFGAISAWKLANFIRKL